MSTRATYKVGDQYFYIHHDGYEIGAAGYFFKMLAMTIRLREEGDRPCDPIDSYSTRGPIEFAFIRGNHNCEPTDCHEAHGDTEFQYQVWTTDRGRVLLAAYAIHRDWIETTDGGRSHDTRTEIFMGPIEDFIEQHLGAGVLVSGLIGPDHYRRWVYAPLGVAQSIARRMMAYADTFEPSNPNRQVYTDKAEHWSQLCAEALARGLEAREAAA